MMQAHHVWGDQLLIVLLSMVPGLPLVMAFCLLYSPLRRFSLKLAPWTALTAVLASLLIHSEINLEVSWFFMGGRMGLDTTGRTFLLFTGLIWLISGLFGKEYLDGKGANSTSHNFYFFYLIAMCGNFGLIIAQEILGFYLFFGLMSFAAYGLIVHNKSDEAWRAGRIYIILVMISEVLLISALFLLVSKSESMQLSDVGKVIPSNITFLLIFLGFGIKAGALPFHFWLPLAHPVAPAPASAVLSGAMIKAGLLGWLRFLPLGQASLLPEWWGYLFVIMGMLAAFYAVFVGILQENPKTILAYSSISQMGLMTTIVGCGLLVPGNRSLVVGAVTIYALQHGLAKAALFLGTGMVYHVRGRCHKPSWWFWMGLTIPCLALSGLPLTGGFLAKQGFKELVYFVPPVTAQWLSILLPLAAGGTALLLCYFYLKIKLLAEEQCDAVGFYGLWWIVMLLMALGLPWIWPLETVIDRSLPTMGEVAGALGPLFIGVLIGLFWGLRLWKRTRYNIPAGDIVVLFSCFNGQWHGKSSLLFISKFQNLLKVGVKRYLPLSIEKIYMAVKHFENLMKRWTVVGSCYAVLLCILLLMLTYFQ
ncbi:MAG: complex I subunit 5 family protein [Desulfobulbaceae bacterium]|nr:complex I subunit 5 family protein [Desulfobulbaceae bacterium]